MSDLLPMVTPAAWSAEERSTKPLAQIMTHELTHNAVFYIGGPEVPKWLQEGLAVFVAGQLHPGAQREVMQQVASGERDSLEEINGIFTGLASLADVGAGYELTGSVVKFMVDQYSFQNVQQVLVELGSGRTLDQAWTQSLLGQPR